MLLFAYGTLINPKKAERIFRRKPKFRLAFLPDYELVFNVKSSCGLGNPNLKVGGRGVWGVVYDVNEDDLKRLDRVSPRYKRIEVDVIVDGKRMRVWTYIGKEIDDNITPDVSCIERIIEGAEMREFPREYIDWLKNLKNSVYFSDV